MVTVVDSTSPTYWTDAVYDGSLPVRDDPGRLYVAAVYWSMYTLTGVGNGDIVPSNSLERIVNAVTMMCGTLVMAVIFGKFNLLVLRSNALNTRHLEKVAY